MMCFPKNFSTLKFSQMINRKIYPSSILCLIKKTLFLFALWGFISLTGSNDSFNFVLSLVNIFGINNFFNYMKVKIGVK